MKESVLQLLCCPACKNGLSWFAYDKNDGYIEEGIVWCTACYSWYPIEERLLELLPPNLAYVDDRKRFWSKHSSDLEARGLKCDQESSSSASVEMQKKQQEHFDWYSHNDTQDYNSYENLPFWKAVDAITFSEWRKRIQPNKWLLDIGCAQGRSAFKFMDLPLNIVGFDISKPSIRQAIDRYRSTKHNADAVFFCADGSDLPFIQNSFDYVLIYGVLHHLPDPGATCRQIADILKPNGIYLGSENNNTLFRSLFDWSMKIKPLWYEEAGAEPLISAKQYHEWFAGTSVHVEINTHVFVLPHLLNLFGNNFALKFLQLSDRIGKYIPFLRHHGGLIQCYGTHK